MSEFKVGDEVLIFDADKAGVHNSFQGKVVKLIEEFYDQGFWINAEEFKHPEISGNFTAGWVYIKGIRKATPLDKALL